jgi:ankyrin repeat protein
MSNPKSVSILFTVLGLNRAGRILYLVLFVLAAPALAVWFVWLPRARFSDEDERLFRAARHGDRTAVEQALAAGAQVNAASPVDGKTALSRAAILGQAEAVRALLGHGADPMARGWDGRSAIEVVASARADEKDLAAARALDAVADLLRDAESKR